MAHLLPDLDVTSVLNIVEDNFKRVDLKTYAIRIIYIGEHALPKADIAKVFKCTVTDVNSLYCDLKLNGFLLVYDSYFIHVLEGSEDTIHRQLRFLFKREQDYISTLLKKEEEILTEGLPSDEEAQQPEIKMFRRMKLLIVYHSIQTRLFTTWRLAMVKPPALVTKLDVYAPMAEHIEQFKICLDKLKKVCEYAQTNPQLNFDLVLDGKADTLPEAGLLDFILSSKYVPDMRYCFHLHRRVDDYLFYFEEVWPLPTHFTPRLLYKLKIDDSFVEPLPVMPWEIVKQEEEEKAEGQSSSSSD